MIHRLLALLCLLTAACNVAPGDPLVAPDSPVEHVEARGTADGLFLEVEGPLQWPLGSFVEVQLDAFDDEDRLIEELSGWLRARAADDPQRQVQWWPVTRRPTTLAVRVLLDERIVFSHRIESIGEVPPAEGDRCDTMGARDRCGMGHLCWPVDIGFRGGGRIERAGRFDGRCVAGEARAWRADPRFAPADQFGAIDLRVPDAPDADGPVFVDVAHPERGSRRWSRNFSPAPTPGQGWRGTLPLADHFEGDGPLPAAVDLYVGPHLFARDLPLEAPPARPLGAACDPARTADACAPETLCDDGACVRAATPRVVDLHARGHQGGVTLSFEGHDADADIVRYDVDITREDGRSARSSLDAWGALRNWYPLAIGDGPADGSIEAAGGVHRAHLTFGHRFADDDPVSVTVTATDAWGSQHAATVGVEPALPEPVEAGAECDPYAIEFECPAGRVCDVADGSEGFACHGLDACPSPSAALDEQGLEARWTDAPSPLAVFSCSGYLGEPETPRQTHTYTFTARRPGDHRFIAEPRGTISAVSVRRRCDLPRTELSCGNTRYPQGFAPLEAGETVHIVVQRPIAALWQAAGWWQLDDPDTYTLRVEVRE